MRKSYESKIKTFALAGKNKSIKHSPEKSIGLLEMAKMPEEDWNARSVAGKSVLDGLSSTISSNLERAMRMQPVPVPNTAYWEEMLGHEKTKPTSVVADPKVKHTAKVNGYVNGNRPHAINTQATNSEVARPKRTAKKRRYDDLSFEGYGEGYVDDEADIVDAGGYSSGDGASRGSASKKRKTVGWKSPGYGL